MSPLRKAFTAMSRCGTDLLPWWLATFGHWPSGKGQINFGANAPVRLIYVADIGNFGEAGFQEPGLKDPETQKAYYHVDTGLIAGNVYLFAASQGLVAWFHNCNKAELVKRLGLRPDQRPLFGQTVGYPESGRGL